MVVAVNQLPGYVADAKTMREVLSSQFHTFRSRPYFIAPLAGKRNASFREAMLFNSYVPHLSPQRCRSVSPRQA